ncbi:unnamed protein product [Rhizophagus irregularis]|nr:unnamed protein product [Rhizophagus irregularis]
MDKLTRLLYHQNFTNIKYISENIASINNFYGRSVLIQFLLWKIKSGKELASYIIKSIPIPIHLFHLCLKKDTRRTRISIHEKGDSFVAQFDSERKNRLANIPYWNKESTIYSSCIGSVKTVDDKSPMLDYVLLIPITLSQKRNNK